MHLYISLKSDEEVEEEHNALYICVPIYLYTLNKPIDLKSFNLIFHIIRIIYKDMRPV